MTKLLAIAVVFLSFEHSAQATALSLRESLDRDNGNIEQIAGEYHGEKDPKDWEPRTKAYIARVVNSQPVKNVQIDKQSSTFDKELAKQTPQSSRPSIAAIYEAYKNDKMTDQEASEFEADVNNGLVMLPSGATLKGYRPNTSTHNAALKKASLEDTNIDKISAEFNEWIQKNKKIDEEYNLKTKRLLGELSGDQKNLPDDSIDKFSAGFQKWKAEQDKNNSAKQENTPENLSLKSGETTLAGFAKAALGMLVAGIEGTAKFISNLFKGLQSQDDNAKAVYGDQTGLPVNCRAYVQATIDSYRQHQYSADDAFAGLERNCGIYGAIWKENRDKD